MERTFLQTDLTGKMLIALGYAIHSLTHKHADGRELNIAEDFQKLVDKIKKENLDVRLVSRDY